MPSFRRVLDAVDDVWRNRRDEVDRQADALADAIERRTRLPQDLTARAGDDADVDPGAAGRGADGVGGRRAGGALRRGVGRVRARPEIPPGPAGGALPAPPPRRPATESSLAMATTTLGAMAAGGIYDHLGGGFARYSTDATWTVPHFEKMLYDQAGLVRAYLHAWQVTGEARWLQVVEETDRLRARRAGVTGWRAVLGRRTPTPRARRAASTCGRPAEIAAALGPELGAVAARLVRGHRGGQLRGPQHPATAARCTVATAARGRRGAPAAVRGPRAARVHPGLDDKVLTEWNAMFGSSLAEAAAATGRQDWAAAAVRIGEFLLAELRRSETGRWLRSWQDGRARHLAYAGDYAWLVELLHPPGRAHRASAVWLDHAARDRPRHARALRRRNEGELLYTTGIDAERLVVRPMEILDGAVPARQRGRRRRAAPARGAAGRRRAHRRR